MLSSIILIIVTKDRHDFLKRALELYQSYDIDILVADASKERFEHNFKRVKYINTSKCENIPKELIEITKELKDSKYRYITISADDDFILKSSIEKCYNFLEKNSDFTSAQGNSMGYKVLSSDKIASSLVYLDSINSSLDEESFLKRANSWLTDNYLCLSYSVNRVENFLFLVELFVKYEISQSIFYEYLMEFSHFMSGKHKVLPTLHSLRDWNFNSTGYSKDRIFHKLIEGDEYQRFLKAVKEMVIKSDNIDSDDEVVKLFDSFFNSRFNTLEKAFANNEVAKAVEKKFYVDIKSDLEFLPQNSPTIKKEVDEINNHILKHISIFDKYINEDIKPFEKELKYIDELEAKKVSIYGAGVPGLLLKKSLDKYTDIEILYFIDDYKEGVLDDIKIIELEKIDKDIVILIPPTRYQENIVLRLKEANIENYIKILPNFAIKE